MGWLLSPNRGKKLALGDLATGAVQICSFTPPNSTHQRQKQARDDVFHFFKQSLTWAFIKFLSISSKLYPWLFAF